MKYTDFLHKNVRVVLIDGMTCYGTLEWSEAYENYVIFRWNGEAYHANVGDIQSVEQFDEMRAEELYQAFLGFRHGLQQPRRALEILAEKTSDDDATRGRYIEDAYRRAHNEMEEEKDESKNGVGGAY